MNTLEVLKLARDLISTPDKWIKDEFALDSDGDVVDEISENAVCFCSYGAFNRVLLMYNVHTYDAKNVLTDIIKTQGYNSIVQWNDAPERTHADVLATFDMAIAKLS